MTASWSAAYAPHGSPVSRGPVDWPALRWSIAIIWYCPAYTVSGLIAAISHSGPLERIPPGASVNTGNPVPCLVYQIFASPLSTYGTRVSSRDSDCVTQPMVGPPATTGIGVVRGRAELERLRRPAAPERSCAARKLSAIRAIKSDTTVLSGRSLHSSTKPQRASHASDRMTMRLPTLAIRQDRRVLCCRRQESVRDDMNICLPADRTEAGSSIGCHCALRPQQGGD